MRLCRSVWPPFGARAGRDARHLRRDGDAVAGSRGPTGERRRRGRSDRSAIADALRQGGDLRIDRKTSRLLIVHEDVKTLGIGAELSAIVMEERFDVLDAPVMRVTYPDTHCPFSQVLEQLQPAERGQDLRRAAAPGGLLGR